MSEAAQSGVIIVDKPAGPTSQDVVGRLKRTLPSRKVGHAGTLDPMATGVLVVGFGRGTRLLTFLVGVDKSYTATIRLGWASDTDDADGALTQTVESAALGKLSDDAIRSAAATLTGPIVQVPSAVSAIKVAGKRAYERVRAGEEVTLTPRPVVVSSFIVLRIRRDTEAIDVDVSVSCSSGTYVRALARDLGAVLACGGHLTALRRTRVGPFEERQAMAFVEIQRRGATAPYLGLGAAAQAFLPTWVLDDHGAAMARHGRPLTWPADVPAGTTAVLTPARELLAVVEPVDGRTRYLAVFCGPDAPAVGARDGVA